MRGKYAARAANRMADLDNALLAEKRSEIEKLQEQNHNLSHELNALRADINGQVLQLLSSKLQRERDLLAATLAAERQQMRDAMDEAADIAAATLGSVFRGLIEKFGTVEPMIPKDTTGSDQDPQPTLARMFSALAPKRAGALLDIAIGGEIAFAEFTNGRMRRRRSANSLNKDIRFAQSRTKKSEIAQAMAKQARDE